jgi:hypothetical protein
LNELKVNLASRAKKEKKSLGNIFLLNNYNHILKTVKGSELFSIIANQSDFTKEYEKAIAEQRDIYRAR